MEREEPIILAIDTATEICSVALFSRERVLFAKESEKGRNHAALIAPFVREALTFAKVNNLKIVAVAVNGGPGSYTGLRIGASFAKGFCFARTLPLIAISGLQGMARAFRDELLTKNASPEEEHNTLFCPMIDAGRMEVYCALYDFDGQEILKPEARIVDANSFAKETKGRKVYYFGNGASKCQPVLASPQAELSDYPLIASLLHRSVFEAFDKSSFQDTAYWVPDYIKTYTAVKAKNKVLNK